MCVKLEKGINRHELDTCAPVERFAGNAREDLLHHAIRAVVTVLVWVARHQALAIQKPVIDSPAINADAVERSRQLASFAQTNQRLAPQFGHIPEAVSVQQQWPVGETMYFLQIELLPIKARQHDAPALRAQID